MRLLRVLMFLFDVTLLPLLGFTAESSRTCTPSSPGSHSLHYSLTVLCQDGFVQPSFSAEGRLDGQAFLHYDRGKGRAEPQGPWAEDFAAEMWDTEIKDLTENGRDLRQLLAETMSLQEDKGGLHSLQETVGCEIREDGQARGFRSICYDGKLFLSCHPETHGCRVPQSLDQTLAMEIKKSWDTDGFQSKHYWAHVQGELCARLRSYVESRMGFTDRTVAWLQDEDPVSQDAQQSGGVLPDGNGTYWTWVTVNIPQGEKQRFTCHVDHSGNHSAHPVSSGNTLMHWSPWLTLAAVVVCIFIMF